MGERENGDNSQQSPSARLLETAKSGANDLREGIRIWTLLYYAWYC